MAENGSRRPSRGFRLSHNTTGVIMKWLVNSILRCFDYFHYPSLATFMNIKKKRQNTTKRKERKANNEGQTGSRPNSTTYYYKTI